MVPLRLAFSWLLIRIMFFFALEHLVGHLGPCTNNTENYIIINHFRRNNNSMKNIYHIHNSLETLRRMNGTTSLLLVSSLPGGEEEEANGSLWLGRKPQRMQGMSLLDLQHQTHTSHGEWYSFQLKGFNSWHCYCLRVFSCCWLLLLLLMRMTSVAIISEVCDAGVCRDLMVKETNLEGFPAVVGYCGTFKAINLFCTHLIKTICRGRRKGVLGYMRRELLCSIKFILQ